MAEEMKAVSYTMFGGVNYADDPGSLFGRAFKGDDKGNFGQFAPVELPDLQNMDFFPSGIGKRLGSTYSATLTTLMATVETAASVAAGSEELIRGRAFTQASGTRAQVIVGKYGMYANIGAGWVTITKTGGGGVYYHGIVAGTARAVTKVGFAELDGRLFIGLDQANLNIQVLRSGTTLDPQMLNGNLYTASFGGGTNTIVGSWPLGAYHVFGMQGRLCFGTGDNVIQATVGGQIYDLAAGEYIEFRGPVIATGTFVRRGDNFFNEIIYALTPVGLEFQSGFTEQDAPMWVSGSGECAGYRLVCQGRNWLFYVTTARTIEMANLNRFDDVGRRLKSQDLTRGLFSTIDLTQTALYGHATYNPLKRQAQFSVVDAGQTRPSHTAVLDFMLGEPGTEESLESYEHRARCLVWSINTPAVNEGFVDVFQTVSGPLGVARAGTLWICESGLNDRDSIAIKDYFFLPEFDAGVPTQGKTFRRFAMRSEMKGNWLVYIEAYLNREDFLSGDILEMNQLATGAAVYDTAVYDVDSYVSGGLTVNADWVELWADSSARFKLYNGEADHNYVIVALEIWYQLGVAID